MKTGTAAHMGFFEFVDCVREYGKACAGLRDHVTAHLEPGRATYLKDDRTQPGQDGENVVLTIGEDWQHYLHYVCPVCGQIHFTHKSNIGRQRRIRCECTKDYDIVDGQLRRRPAVHILLRQDYTKGAI